MESGTNCVSFSTVRVSVFRIPHYIMHTFRTPPINPTKALNSPFTLFVSPAQSCGPPPTVKNAVVHTTGDTHLNNASYECNPGLQLVGPKTLTCLANGTWSLPAPSCEGMEKSQCATE